MNLTRKELKDWILINCIDVNGNIDLSGLDFSDFDGDVNISDMKVKGDLYQRSQEVQGNLYQSCQYVQGYLNQRFNNVKGNLYQGCQEVNGDLFQGYQKVKGDFITQTLKVDEDYEIKDGETYIVKKLKKITKEELEEIGYILKEK